MLRKSDTSAPDVSPSLIRLQGGVNIEYCPTEKMWHDVLNKPKQGAEYRLNRSHLMNIPIKCDDDVECKNTHLMLLDNGGDNTVKILPRTWKIPRPFPV